MLPGMSNPRVTQPAAPPGAAADWFDGDDAPGRVDLRTCIHCGLCLTACPTYRELKIEPDSPRGRIFLMRGLAEGRVALTDPLVGHLDRCLDCRACETVCPAGVPYARMLEQTRGQIRRRVPAGGGRRLGEWALRSLFPHRGRMHAAADLLRLGQSAPAAALLGAAAARRLLPEFARRGLELTPPIAPRRDRALDRVAASLPPGARVGIRDGSRVFAPAGTAKARVAFFTSCVMEVMFPHVNRESVRLLVLAGCEVVVPRGQTCCGALQAHAGLRDTAKALARANAAAFDFDADFVVTDSAGCGAALRESGHLLRDDVAAAVAARLAGRVRDVSEVLVEAGPPPAPGRAGAPLRIGYHDPCHLAHAQGVRRPPRALLGALPGVEVVDLPHSDWCCGSAGVYNLTHPELADAQLRHKLDSIDEARVEVVVASNPGCHLHMARGVRARGSRVRLAHLVELLGEAYPPPAGGSRPRS
jgi:Fe-S oxidoreductase